MLEAIKLVGAIAGLLTTAFVIWARWARGRPLAWVTAKKFGVNPQKYIRIKNPGPADVFILGVRAYPSKVYNIAKDHSARAILEAAFNIDVNVLLSQGDKCDLPIFEASKPVKRRKTNATWRSSRLASSSIGAKQVRVGCVRSLS